MCVLVHRSALSIRVQQIPNQAHPVLKTENENAQESILFAIMANHCVLECILEVRLLTSLAPPSAHDGNLIPQIQLDLGVVRSSQVSAGRVDDRMRAVRTPCRQAGVRVAMNFFFM